MLTVLIECRDNEVELAQTLSGLVAGAVEGLVSDVVLLDHGSVDGSVAIADAAGCRIYRQWSLPDVIAEARGSWLMVLEAGARLQSGWVEEITQYLAVSLDPARLSPSRTFRRSLMSRLRNGRRPIETGCLLPKAKAAALARPGMGLAELASLNKTRQLRSEIIPAWALQTAKP